MKRIYAILMVLYLTAVALPGLAEGLTATLNQKITTRSGPSVNYDDTGTFFAESWKTEQVTVIAKARGDDAWWLLVEFSEDGQLYRLYTSARRVNVDIDLVPEEKLLGNGTMSAAGDVPGLLGPGKTYTATERDVPWSVDVTVWAAENSYLLVDFFDEDTEKQRRAWVYTELADINWVEGMPEGGRAVNEANIHSGDIFSDDENNVLTVLEYAPVGGNTVISLMLKGKMVYSSLSVKMEGRDRGAFATAEGDGEIWFDNDEILMDAYLPDFDLADTLFLYRK